MSAGGGRTGRRGGGRSPARIYLLATRMGRATTGASLDRRQSTLRSGLKWVFCAAEGNFSCSLLRALAELTRFPSPGQGSQSVCVEDFEIQIISTIMCQHHTVSVVFICWFEINSALIER